MPVTVITSDLERAFDAIRIKRPALETLFAYAEGPQPLKYSTERLAETFQNINTHFDVNWCTVVIDSTLDRLQMKGFDIGDVETNKKIDIVFDKIHLDIEADKVHQASLTTSQGYIIVWKEEPDGVLAYYNDPRICHVFYEPSNPKKKTYAAKWFAKADSTQEITLYYTDRLEHWTSNKVATGTALDKASAFTLTLVENNPYGVIPVYELKSPGEIYKILSLQDACNKLFSDMMIAAEFGAFVQRWVISNSDPGALKNAPNEIWWIPSGDGTGQQSSTGQFTPTDLSNYIAPMDKIAEAIAIITRTPRHYFMTTGSNVSGEALIAMESPLVKKVKKRQREFGAQWQDIAQFILQLEGIKVDASVINVVWERPETVQPKTEAEVLQIGINIGIPLVTLLRREGWTEKEIASLEKDKAVQEKAKATVATAMLNELRIKQQQMNPDGSNTSIGE